MEKTARQPDRGTSYEAPVLYHPARFELILPDERESYLSCTVADPKSRDPDDSTIREEDDLERGDVERSDEQKTRNDIALFVVPLGTPL